MQFSVLPSRILLLIHPIYNSLCLLIPNSQYIPQPYLAFIYLFFFVHTLLLKSDTGTHELLFLNLLIHVSGTMGLHTPLSTALGMTGLGT